MHRLAIIALVGCTLAANSAPAAERTVGLDDQTAVAVTLYANGLGLVKDHRAAALEAGVNHLAFEGVSAKMIPSSALVLGSGNFRVTEQNFEFDLLSRESLLRRSVGKTIRVVRVHPTTGEDLTEEATVLAAGKTPVLRIGDRIETGIPGRLVFDSLPADLRARPTLVVTLDAPAAETTGMELTYLTEDMGWSATYAAELDPSGKTLDLSAWASLTNNTGTHFDDATVQLVAGDVQREFGGGAPRLMMEAMPSRAKAAPMVREAIGDLHLYTLPRPVTLKNRQTKQVALLAAKAVPVRRDYVLEHWLPNQETGEAEPPTLHPRVRLAFDNATDNHLGIPLPAGLARVYETDSKGRMQFAGEQRIDHVAVDRPVRLNLGEAVDIAVNHIQNRFEKRSVPSKGFESDHLVAVTNAKADPVEVTLVEHFTGEWEIVSSDLQFERTNAGTATWTIPVPANGTANLHFTARVRTR